MTTPGPAQRGVLTFATTNAGKVSEMAGLLAPAGYSVLQDARGYVEIQAATLREVTEAGADVLLASGLRPPFLLEDSGLFVDALQGFPGVYSRHALDTIGVAGLLRLMANVPGARRAARFEADLLLVEADARTHFAGTCPGAIAQEAAGASGFGFDPAFVPAGLAGGETAGRTFAELPPTVKGTLSHRGQAARALAAHLAGRGNQTAKP